MPKNKITTAGYFIKRLRDNGYYVCRIFSKYNETDSRVWTVLINPGQESVFITYYKNKEGLEQNLFEINDGGQRFPKNFQLKTDSIEVIMTYLFEQGIGVQHA